MIKKTLICFIAILVLNVSMAFAQQPMVLPIDAVPLRVVTNNGDIKYDLEVANLPTQTEQGLMYRTDFPKNRAMIFEFPSEQVVSMWMANTPLPLDMLFLNKTGTIVSIAKNTTPFSKSIISSDQPSRFTIELNAGQIAAHNIKKGDKVIHPVICGKCE